jgi:calcineurin-like phosphoesterase family protein
MANRFFASDHHWWHKNIIEYGERPFANIGEMQEALLQFHNEVVKPEDHVSFLGDVTMLRGSGPQREQFIR